MNTKRIKCPWGPFHVTSEPHMRSLYSEICCLNVFLGEYDFPRYEHEGSVRTMVDVGCNVGAFMVWAALHRWPHLEKIDAYDPNANALEFAAVNVRECKLRGVALHHAAVSVDSRPLFKEHIDWGGSRTHGETTGVSVPSVHPRDLPPCDVLKVDAEGVDPDVFDNYAHWAGVKIALFEYHSPDDGRRMRAVLERESFRMSKPGENTTQDVEVWVKQ